MQGVANALLAALVAPPCACCGRVLDAPLASVVCPACWNAVAVQPSTFALPPLSSVCSLGVYDGVLRDLVHALKYEGRRSVAPQLARMMAEHASNVLADVDVVVAVPLHRRRRRERGFNQAEELARGLGLPVVNVLRRIRHTAPQVGLDATVRHNNVRAAFALRRRSLTSTMKARALARAPIIVLIDDVVTTGATLQACARALLEGGAREVRALTAARVAIARLPARAD